VTPTRERLLEIAEEAAAAEGITLPSRRRVRPAVIALGGLFGWTVSAHERQIGGGWVAVKIRRDQSVESVAVSPR
jgi:hypothetical protein